MSSRISQYLDDAGDGSGVDSAVGNYASVAKDFFIQPPAGRKYVLSRGIFTVEDSGGFPSGGYGASSVLTNGITAQVTDSDLNVIDDLTNGVNIKTNAQWGSLCFDTEIKTWPGGGNNYLLVRWTFERDGAPIVLVNRQRFVLTLNDDFSFLIAHRFMVKGTDAWWDGILSKTPYHTFR